MLPLRAYVAAMRAHQMGRSNYWRWRRVNRDVRLAASIVRARTVDKANDVRRTGKESVTALGRGLLGILITVVLLFVSQELPARVGAVASDWTSTHLVERFATWLGQSLASSTPYTAALAAALGVVGTLSGVYFATVAFVISSSYKESTRRVRDLVTQLPASTTYTFIFTQALLFTLGTFAMPLVQATPTRLTLFAVTFASAFVVVAFSRLRQQLYRLLDPLELLAVVERRLEEAIVGAVKQSERRTPSYARVVMLQQQAAEALDAIDDLAKLMLRQENDARYADDAPREDPRISEAAQHIMQLWSDATANKPMLKTLDGWNPTRTVKQRDWFAADHVEIRAALGSRSPLSTTPVPDIHWLEKRLTQSVELMVDNRGASARLDSLVLASRLLQTLMRNGQFEEARLWRTAALGLADTILPHHGATAKTNLDLVDLYVSIWLGDANGLNQYAYVMCENFPDWAVDVTRAGTPTLMSPSAQTLSRDLHDAVAFESAVDRTTVTPDINLAQLMAREISNEAYDEVARQVNQFTSVAAGWLVSVQQIDTSVAGRALMRFDQCLQQFALAVESVRRLVATCEQERRDVDDRWPVHDVSVIDSQLAPMKEAMKAMVSKVASNADPSPPSDAIDLFGWAYHRTFDDILDDVLEGELSSGTTTDERIRNLLTATGSAVRRMIDVAGRIHPRAIDASVSEPTLAFLQLSAAALLIAEVKGEPEVFEPFRKSWDERFSDPETAQILLDLNVVALHAEADLWAITTRSIVRTEVEIRINQTLSSLGVPNSTDPDPHSPAPSVSETARRLLQHVGVGGHLESLFVAAHLIPAAIRAGATIGDLDARTASIVEHLARP